MRITEIVLIGALLGCIAVSGYSLYDGDFNGVRGIQSIPSAVVAIEEGPVLDPYGGPTFASAEEGIESRLCPFGGVERLPPPDTTGRWMCVAEYNPDDATLYETEEEAAQNAPCNNLQPGDETIVVRHNDGYRCEVQRGDPPA